MAAIEYVPPYASFVGLPEVKLIVWGMRFGGGGLEPGLDVGLDRQRHWPSDSRS